MYLTIASQATVQEVLDEIGVVVLQDEIQACHRLKNRSRTIIKFVKRKRAFDCFRNKHRLKDNSKTVARVKLNKLFINESLCPKYRYIFSRGKSFVQQGLATKIWTSNGSIKMKLVDETIITVGHDNDLLRFTQ